MSTRVSLSKYTYQNTQQEDTPVCIRIQLSRATVKDLHSHLPYAYQHDAVRLVRRVTVWLDLLGHQVPMAVWCERWGLSPSCLYAWVVYGYVTDNAGVGECSTMGLFHPRGRGLSS
jgi:hypothetical protein